MNLETKITIYKFTPQLFTLTHYLLHLLLHFEDPSKKCSSDRKMKPILKPIKSLIHN